MIRLSLTEDSYASEAKLRLSRTLRICTCTCTVEHLFSLHVLVNVFLCQWLCFPLALRSEEHGEGLAVHRRSVREHIENTAYKVR